MNKSLKITALVLMALAVLYFRDVLFLNLNYAVAHADLLPGQNLTWLQNLLVNYDSTEIVFIKITLATIFIIINFMLVTHAFKTLSGLTSLMYVKKMYAIALASILILFVIFFLTDLRLMYQVAVKMLNGLETPLPFVVLYPVLVSFRKQKKGSTA